MKKNKRFKGRGGRRAGSHSLSKHVREHYKSDSGSGPGSSGDGDLDHGLDHFTERMAPREAIGSDAANDAALAEILVPAPEHSTRGIVASLASGLAWVETDATRTGDEEPIQCVLPSAVARDQKFLIAVGDRVGFVEHGDGHRIIAVEPRDSYLARPDPLNPRLLRVVAANVDVVVQVASIRKPTLRPALIDRYLIAIQQGGASPLLCINKIDLVPASQRDDALEPLEAYRDMVPVVICSAETGEGIEALRSQLQGKTAVVVGHSGVGKSSLINRLDPSTGAETGEISEAWDKGRHTTTNSSLYDLDGDIRLIDTPGIRELGLWNMDAPTLAAYFPDFDELAQGCRFNNCTHSHEPVCAVQQAVLDGRIPEARYATYLRILESLDAP